MNSKVRRTRSAGEGGTSTGTSQRARTRSASGNARQKHILFVDDCVPLREIFCAFLEMEGFRVSVAEDGESALKLLRKRKCDLLITDLCMPGMRGEELIRHMSEECPQVPVIVVTSEPEPAKCAALGPSVREVLAKPLPLPVLLKIIDKIFPTPTFPT